MISQIEEKLIQINDKKVYLCDKEFADNNKNSVSQVTVYQSLDKDNWIAKCKNKDTNVVETLLNKCREIFVERTAANEYYYLFSEQGAQQCVALIVLECLLEGVYKTVNEAIYSIYEKLQRKQMEGETDFKKITCAKCSQEREWSDFTRSQHKKKLNERTCVDCSITNANESYSLKNNRKCQSCHESLPFTSYSKKQIMNENNKSTCNYCLYSYINAFQDAKIMELIDNERKQRALVKQQKMDNERKQRAIAINHFYHRHRKSKITTLTDLPKDSLLLLLTEWLDSRSCVELLIALKKVVDLQEDLVKLRTNHCRFQLELGLPPCVSKRSKNGDQELCQNYCNKFNQFVWDLGEPIVESLILKFRFHQLQWVQISDQLYETVYAKEKIISNGLGIKIKELMGPESMMKELYRRIINLKRFEYDLTNFPDNKFVDTRTRPADTNYTIASQNTWKHILFLFKQCALSGVKLQLHELRLVSIPQTIVYFNIGIKQLVSLCSQLKTLHISCLPEYCQRSLAIPELHECKLLESISFENFTIDQSVIMNIIDHCIDLKSVSLCTVSLVKYRHETYETYEVIEKLSTCKKLSSLTLKDIKTKWDNIGQFTNLTSVSLTAKNLGDQHIQDLAWNSKCLTSVSLGGSIYITNMAVKHITGITANTTLTSLSFDNVPNLDNNVLQYIVNCTKLSSLIIMGTKITEWDSLKNLPIKTLCHGLAANTSLDNETRTSTASNESSERFLKVTRLSLPACQQLSIHNHANVYDHLNDIFRDSFKNVRELHVHSDTDGERVQALLQMLKNTDRIWLETLILECPHSKQLNQTLIEISNQGRFRKLQRLIIHVTRGSHYGEKVKDILNLTNTLLSNENSIQKIEIMCEINMAKRIHNKNAFVQAISSKYPFMFK